MEFTQSKQANELISKVQMQAAKIGREIEITREFTATLREIFENNGKIAAISKMKTAYNQMMEKIS